MDTNGLESEGATGELSRPHRRARRLAVLALLIGSTLLALAAAEGAIRLWVLVRHDGNVDLYNVWNSIYEAHPHSWYRPRPGRTFRIFGGRYLLETDSHGFRSPEPAAVKAPGTFRIAFLGGSTTFNSESPSNTETVALQTLRMLREARPDLDVEVMNAATPGYTTMESLTTLVSRVLPLDPDLVVVYHGINDASFRVRGEYRTDFWHEPKPSRTRFDSWLYRRSLLFRFVTYKAIVNAPVSRPPPEALRAAAFANPPTGFERNLRSMLAVTREHGAELMLSSFAHCPDPELPDRESWEIVFDAVDEQNALVERLAAETGAPYLDLATLFPADCDLFTNQVHRTAEGLRQHARLLADAILDGGLLDD